MVLPINGVKKGLYTLKDAKLDKDRVIQEAYRVLIEGGEFYI
jgi:ubiquinone/menaquinone biosynthesis C-methylase UbiE